MLFTLFYFEYTRYCFINADWRSIGQFSFVETSSDSMLTSLLGIHSIDFMLTSLLEMYSIDFMLTSVLFLSSDSLEFSKRACWKYGVLIFRSNNGWKYVKSAEQSARKPLSLEKSWLESNAETVSSMEKSWLESISPEFSVKFQIKLVLSIGISPRNQLLENNGINEFISPKRSPAARIIRAIFLLKITFKLDHISAENNSVVFWLSFGSISTVIICCCRWIVRFAKLSINILMALPIPSSSNCDTAKLSTTVESSSTGIALVGLTSFSATISNESYVPNATEFSNDNVWIFQWPPSDKTNNKNSDSHKTWIQVLQKI